MVQTDVQHKYLVQYLRNYVAADLSAWDRWMKCAVFVHNMTPHSATSYMPFRLLPGRLPNLPGVLKRQPPVAFICTTRMYRNWKVKKVNVPHLYATKALRVGRGIALPFLRPRH